jgi:hypothetical protein
MVVAIIALVVASGGTAIAAGSLVNGDSLIKKGTLSGNRLRSHTITGKQVNLKKLGKVPSAHAADLATKATSATSATNATNATNALNATNATNALNATNATNATHATSATTATGLATLASGHSESGFYTAASGSVGYVGQGITYAQPLATAIADTKIIWNKAGTTSTHCTGYGHADPGYLCLYDNEESGTSAITAFYSTGFSSPSVGAILYWYLTASGFVSGEYTVTAP